MNARDIAERENEKLTFERRVCAPTLPPTKADQETHAFELLVQKVGEGQARWSRLLELLEGES